MSGSRSGARSWRRRPAAEALARSAVRAALCGIGAVVVACGLLPPKAVAQRGFGRCAGEPAQGGRDVLTDRPGSRGTSVASNGRDARGTRPGSPNPLAGLSFYVDPTERSAQDHRRYSMSGQAAKARQIEQLALAPKFAGSGASAR